MKITILLRRDSDEITGDTIAAHNRTKELLRNFSDAEIKLIVLREYMHPVLHWINNSPLVKKDNYFTIEDLDYEAKWFNFSIIDNILTKLRKKPITLWKQLSQFVDELIGTDILIAHSFYAGYVAMLVKEKYNIPYTVTWHGSDIHTLPEQNEYLRDVTTRIIQNADANHFVSNDLLIKSDKLSICGNKSVLYNGVDRKKFYRFKEDKIKVIKKEYNIDENLKNIAFIGNFYVIKNVLSLPAIFRKVQERTKACFHFVGTGSLRDNLEQRCKDNKIRYKIWDYQPSDKIPSIINCMDMLVLPSFNEGLPLITLESLACGVPVVGSRVGGIPEAIGISNTVAIDEDFEDNMAKLIMTKLDSKEIIEADEQFSWEYTGKKEVEIIRKIVSQYTKI